MTTKETADKATQLYFEIEKHFALGGGPLTIREVGAMLGYERNSTGSPNFYLAILKKWGLVKSSPGSIRTIVLASRNYPSVEWRKME